MNFKDITHTAISLLKSDLKVDLNSNLLEKDLTSQSIINKNSKIKVSIVAKDEIILCGITFIKKFIHSIEPKIKVEKNYKDGDLIYKNQVIAIFSGNGRKIMAIERTVLNFLQHLSSVSTSTYRISRMVKSKKTRILDTRKTITGLRSLQKYATFVGGAINHRFGLYDQVLIKDNHIEICGGIEKVLQILKSKKIKNYKIECDTLNQVKKCIDYGSRYILLDNMNVEKIKKCMNIRGRNKVIFEITGGINEKNISLYSKLNPDFISIGSITQNPKAVDISMDIIKRL